MTVHHIGIIVEDISKSIPLYTRLGYKLTSPIIFDHIQRNRVALMASDFPPQIELVEAANKNSTVHNFKGYHHICYEAEPGKEIVQEFKLMKIGKIFTKPLIAPALGNRKVVFACLQNGTFIELII